MIRKGNMIKCERCSDKAGKSIFFFSRKYAEHKVKPTSCPICKQYSWEKVRK
jgi:hypothetical protein